MVALLRVSPLSIALGYIIIASIWILFSDRVIEYGADSIEALSILQSVKGLFFVLVTGGLLYIFTNRLASGIEKREREKQRSDREFEKLFQNTPLPMWVYDRKSDSIVEVNRAAINKYGYSRSEFFRLSKDEIFIRQFSDQVQFDNTVDDVDAHSQIWEHATKDGRSLKVKVNVDQIDYNGQDTELVRISDLTQKEQVMQDLKHAYDQLYYHISNTPLAVIEFDADFKVKFWSDRAGKIFGWKSEEVIGLHPDEWEFIYEKDKELVDEAIGSLLSGGDKGWQVQNRNYHKDGSVKYLNWFNSRILDETGQSVVSVLSLAEDITGQQNYRERVNRYQQRFEIAADLASDVIWELDIGSNEIWFSDSVIESFQREDMSGRVDLSIWEKYIDPARRNEVKQSLDHHINNGKEGMWEERYRFKKGDATYAYVIDRGQIQFDSEGKPLRMVGTMIDETERRIYEEKMQQWNRELEKQVRERTRKLESLNEELEAFTYSVSHDLKAPVRSIDGFTRALKDHLNDHIDGEADNYINRVLQAGERMGNLINDLLTLSRITRKEISYEDVNLTELAGEVIAGLRQLEPEREVCFHCEDNMIIRGDEKLIRIMFDNLIGNAWKFTRYREDARIELGLKNVTRHDTEYHEIILKDNGDGFEEAYAEKLYRPFQRLHNKSEFEGTGIGLATVKRVASRHDAEVSAKGEKGKGAEFSVYWPVK